MHPQQESIHQCFKAGISLYQTSAYYPSHQYESIIEHPKLQLPWRILEHLWNLARQQQTSFHPPSKVKNSLCVFIPRFWLSTRAPLDHIFISKTKPFLTRLTDTTGRSLRCAFKGVMALRKGWFYLTERKIALHCVKVTQNVSKRKPKHNSNKVPCHF